MNIYVISARSSNANVVKGYEKIFNFLYGVFAISLF